MNYKESILEAISQLRDFNANVESNPELAEFYQGWIDEVESENVRSEKLIRWIDIQISYYREKDRGYSRYLESLINDTRP